MEHVAKFIILIIAVTFLIKIISFADHPVRPGLF